MPSAHSYLTFLYKLISTLLLVLAEHLLVVLHSLQQLNSHSWSQKFRKLGYNSRMAEPVWMVQFWLDHFSKEVKNIFQLTKNQMHG